MQRPLEVLLMRNVVRRIPFRSLAAVPVVTNVRVTVDGVTTTITFSQPVTGQTGFSFTTPTSALTYQSGEGTTALVFLSAVTITSANTPRLSYTGSAVKTGGGVLLYPFTGFPVTNLSVQ